MAGVHQLPAVGLPEEKGALGANLPVPSASRLGDPSNKDVSGSASDSDIEQLEDEMRGRTLMEKKMILINRALNAQGMGRYQWCIFFLAGAGYLVDLAFAKLFGLILSPMATELGISASARGNLSACFNAGLCVGAFTWGFLVDIIGRKWAFNLSLFITSFFGLFLGVPSSYTAICVLALFCGLGLGGNIPIDATIVLEWIPARNRWLLVMLSVFQPLGVLLCSLISWGLIPSRTCALGKQSCSSVPAGADCCTKGENMGWRLASYTIGGLCLALFVLRFLIFNMRETPKFLLIKGRDAEAIEVVRSVAKFNKLDPDSVPLSLDDFRRLEAEAAAEQTGTDISTDSDDTAMPLLRRKNFSWALLKRKFRAQGRQFKVLFATRRIIFITVLIFFIYMLDYFAFSLAGTFLPTILREKGAARAVPVRETYRNYIIQACCGIPGVAIGALLCNLRWLGQKWSMAITAILMGVCLMLYAVIDSQDANVAFNALEYTWQSSFNAILYGSAPLYFPTAVRGVGVGTASSLGRMIGIIAPIAGAQIYAGINGLNGILYVAGAPMFAVAILCVFLPNIKKGHTY